VARIFREGLTAVISIRVPQPQFEGQTKTKLGNGEVEGIINTALGDFLAKYLEENPKLRRHSSGKPRSPAEAREAARADPRSHSQAQKRPRRRGLPGKLRDCISSEMEKCELYLVEGDSAGGPSRRRWPAPRFSGDPAAAGQDH